MNCSFWARAAVGRASPRRAGSRPTLHNRAANDLSERMENLLPQYIYCYPRTPLSGRERPQPELLLSDLPEPGQAVRLHRQEKENQRAEGDELQVRGQALADPAGEERVGGDVQEDGEQDDEGRAQKGSQ